MFHRPGANRFFCFSLIGFLFLASAGAQERQIRFDFESGDLQAENWIVSSGTNTKPIGSRDKTFHYDSPYPKRGEKYLTALESAENDATHEYATCVLESPVFRPDTGPFTFYLGGGNIPETWLALCELLDDGSAAEIAQFRGQNKQSLEQVTLDLSDRIGKPLFFRLVDQGTGAWSYLHADDFQGTGSVDAEATERRRHYLLSLELDKTEQSIEKLRPSLQDWSGESSAPRIDPLLAECRRIGEDKSAPYREAVERLEALRSRIAATARDSFLETALIKETPILYISRPQFPYEHHNTETTYQTDDICTGKMPQTGSALKLWTPSSGKLTTLLEVERGIVRDPCVHFDGQHILVSIRWDIDDDFHLYEIDLTGRDLETEPLTREDLTQLTYGPGISDIDPQYLPDGRIVFSSSREPKYCMCNRHIMMNLHTMNRDGSNILQIGHSTLYEGHSSLLPDGRILYYRWEYVDRNFSDAQGAWTVNPDGTNHALFWGNNTESPAATIDPRTMPDSNSEFVCTMIGCHISPWGAIGLIDRQKGLDGKEPVIQVWPPEARDLIGTYNGRTYDNLLRLSQFFEDPWPLDDSLILAAGTIPHGTPLPTGDGESETPGVTGIWLLTLDGGQYLLHTDPVGCFDPMPLAASEAPPGITDRVVLKETTGRFYVTDVNEGFAMEKVPRGTAKYLRVVEAPEKRFWTHPSWVGADAKGNQQAPAMNWDEFGNKRILGVVPVEDDGSVYFTLPSDRFVFFQLLDENKEMIQSMRSGVIVRPGETNGCYGCHEDRLETPFSSRLTAAMKKEPRAIAPEFDRPAFLFSYTAEVQPILDRYCVQCHDWPTEESTPLERQAAEKVVLCGDLNPLFNQSYWQIREKKLVSAVGSAYAEKIEPLVWGARHSKLVDVMKRGHDGGGPIDQKRKELGLAPVAPNDVELVAAWIDLNAPYYPDFSTGFPDNPYGRSPLTFAETDRLAQLTGFVPTNDKMAWGGRIPNPLEPAVSFSRPERSPCLNKWNTPESQAAPEYQEALALLQAGAERLKAAPREDMPGWKLTNPIEIRRNEKYNVLRERAARMQRAQSAGEKLFDRDNQLLFDACFEK